MMFTEESDTPWTLFTLCDSNYLPRACHALESSGVQGNAVVLALDHGAMRIVQAFPLIRVQALDDFLAANPLVKNALQSRSWTEQIFTIGPSLVLSYADSVPENSWLIYSDADISYHADLDSYLEPFGDANVIISPHKHYWWNRRRLKKYGEFNVGMVAFRNNNEGRKALKFWADSCLDWCRDVVQDGLYADQKYLESFAKIAEVVVVDDRNGVNLAPWNSSLQKVTGRTTENLRISGDRIWYSHMQGLRVRAKSWQLGHLAFLSLAGPRLKSRLYLPYLARLHYWADYFYLAEQASVRVSKMSSGLMFSIVWRFLHVILKQEISNRRIERYRLNDSDE